jgi:hypothetical protein
MLFSKIHFNNRHIKIILVILFLFLSTFILYYIYGKNKSTPVRYSVSGFDLCYLMSQSNKQTNMNVLLKCYRILVHNLMSVESLGTVLSQLEMRKDDKVLIQDCHTIGHFLGQEEYEKTKNIATSLAECTNYCYGGCYHGAVEQYFLDKYANGNISLTDLPIQINTLCTNNDSACSLKREQAQHGLGHALIQITNYDLNKALSFCGDMEQCYYGVFMQNVNSKAYMDAKGKDILYPCDILNVKYQTDCYSSLSTEVYKNVKDNINLCSQFPTQYQKSCYQSVDTAKSSTSKDIYSLKNDCGNIHNIQIKKWCIEGIAFTLLSKYYDNYQLSINFCNIQDGEFRNDCFNSIVAQNFDANKIKKLCSLISKDIKLQTCNSLTKNFLN